MCNAPPAGHETTFCALLYCLARLGVVGAGDAQALVVRVFSRYLHLMRKIQVGGWVGCSGVRWGRYRVGIQQREAASTALPGYAAGQR